MLVKYLTQEFFIAYGISLEIIKSIQNYKNELNKLYYIILLNKFIALLILILKCLQTLMFVIFYL